MTAKLYTDGSLDHNNFIAGTGFVLQLFSQGKLVQTLRRSRASVLHTLDSGVVEALALREGLLCAKETGYVFNNLTWYTDCLPAMHKIENQPYLINNLLAGMVEEFDVVKLRAHVPAAVANEDEAVNRICDRDAGKARVALHHKLKNKAKPVKAKAAKSLVLKRASGR